MKKMREALKDYSEPPAPEGWSKLEAELSPVGEKRIRPYTWWAVAATLLLAVSGVSLFFMQTPTADDIRHTMAPTLAVTPDVMPVTQEPEIQITEVKPDDQSGPKQYTYLSDATSIEKKVQETVLIISEDDVKQREEEQYVENSTPSDKNETVTNEVKQKTDQQSSDKPDDRRVVKPSGKDKLHLPVVSEKKRSSEGKWSVGASFSNGTSASTSQSQDYLSMADLSTSQNGGLASGMISINDKNELVFDGGIPYVKQSASITEIKHKQPISFGLSVRKNLSNGFSVETGLTYTMLSSEGKSVTNASNKVEQKLHYVGIPLRGNWNFVESKRFTVYLTAGGMVEKCVYGKVAGEKETVKPLQFSLAGGVGGQLNITDRIGLYVEPGVSYFFDDGSDVETIRKENPLNFNLQGGIRFTY
ncbi:hypothetical protein D0T87_05840 [Bacteroides sp. 51]|nr:hypothetical protein [Bacteroides sp. 51]